MPGKNSTQGWLRAGLWSLLASLALFGFDGAARPGGSAGPEVARTGGPLAHDAYLWQRSWTPAVHEAITRHAADPRLGELLILAAELDGPEVALVEWDPAALAEAGVESVGLVIRVGPWSGPFGGPEDPVLPALLGAVEQTLARARGAGLELAELQLDFDAASDDLAGYARWLDPVRELAGATPVTITALPDWLGRPELAALLRETDGWVLQVHGLRPMTRGEPAEILDVDAARRAVEAAAILAEAGDRPLRVALPTYTYLVARDPWTGELEGIAAEQAPARIDRDRFERAEADPAAIAELVATWTADRPAAVTGLAWFRLPVAGDRLAWSWPSFSAVVSGRAPPTAVHVRACAVTGQQLEPGVVELELVNEGEADAWIDGPIRVPVPLALLAGDAFDPFSLAQTDPRAVELRPEAHVRVAAGERRPVAWLRLDVRGERALPTDTTCPARPR